MRRLFVSAIAAASLLVLISASIEDASAKGRSGGSRPSYSGSKHSSSHGGNYAGGSGKSHKGGDYKNSRSGDRYGKHKQ
jgi:hypothetical protein